MISARDPSPALGISAKAVAALAFSVAVLGGLVTTNSAGMAFPDWPLSNGSVLPAGWLSELPKFLEHSHRLLASTLGLCAIALCFWVFRDEGARRWRTLAVFALAGVILQGLYGGLRVRLETALHPQAALAFRITHGCVAPIVVCLFVALATVLSPRWRSWPALGALPVKLGWITLGAVYLQIAFGAAMRHMGAGLAIPTWPAATPDGRFMPAVHGPYTDTNFTHTRFGAIAVTLLIFFLSHRAFHHAAGCRRLRRPAVWLLALVLIQFTLGVLVIWHLKPLGLTTLHVVNGHLVLVTSLLLALRLRRAASLSVLTAAART